MNVCFAILRTSARWLLVPLVLAASACATPHHAAPAVTVTANQTNVVAFWNDIANQTVLAASPASAVNPTPEEQRPAFFFDVASVHVAIYDAVVAIEGRYKPFAVKPKATAAGASTEAAVNAAAHGVLKALFPNRSTVYQAAYEQRMAAVPDGNAKALGLALGSEVAAAVVRLRANDGRLVALTPYASGTAPGQSSQRRRVARGRARPALPATIRAPPRRSPACP